MSALAANSDVIVGRTGRRYRNNPSGGSRDGGMATVRPVIAEGEPNAQSTVATGTVLALKIAREDDPLGMEAMAREVEVFAALCRSPGQPPCPRLYDVVGSPAVGIVMEWCPDDLERWWADRCDDTAAFPLLCGALAELCRRVREYSVVAEMELGRRVVHADIKPRNVLLAASGRWLLTDFGASKSRSVDEQDWAATKMILGTENFIAPEALFNAKKSIPAALDTWSIGCTFFALLRMRPLLRGGGSMPANGTHAHHFRTHRAALVADLQLRKPAIFADRELDPTQFTSPDRLPEKDRVAIADALAGTFSQPALEARLVADVTNLLDRALQIAPARRYTDALELASDFEALAIRWRELALRADGGPTGPRASAPAVAPPRAPIRPAPRQKAGGNALTAFFAVAGCLLVAFALSMIVIGSGGAWWYFGTSNEVNSASAEVVAPAASDRARAVAVMAQTSQPPAEPLEAVKPNPPPAKKSPRSPREGEGSVAESGTLLVLGAGSYLMGPSGKMSTGTVAPGRYEIFAAVGDNGAFSSQGTVDVAAGERITWRCGFGSCKQVTR